MIQKITPFLWFENRAEEAAEFYTSIFKNSKILEISRFGEGTPGEPGAVMTVTFELEGQRFVALNGGPVFHFTPAISFYVDCATQEEVDYFWERLTDGGEESMCAWLTDKFGVSWQIVPRLLTQLMSDPDRTKAQRVIDAMLQMRKIDTAALQKAYDSE